jgi:hypothetical protein
MGEIGIAAADKTEELALSRRPGGAAHRTFDKGRTLGAQLFRKRDFRLRLHRTHVDEELAFEVRRQQAQWSAIGRFDRGGVGQYRDHDLDGFCEIGGRCGDLGASLRERLRFLWRTVPDRRLIAGLHQPRGDGRTHLANAGDTDMHGLLLLSCRTIRSAATTKIPGPSRGVCSSLSNLTESERRRVIGLRI